LATLKYEIVRNDNKKTNAYEDLFIITGNEVIQNLILFLNDSMYIKRIGNYVKFKIEYDSIDKVLALYSYNKNIMNKWLFTNSNPKDIDYNLPKLLNKKNTDWNNLSLRGRIKSTIK
jgi:hypothetical protein